MLSLLAISLGIEMDPATGVPNFVNCVSGDTSLTPGGHNPESCVCMRDHFPILVGLSVQKYTQYLLLRCHLLRVPRRANHGMSSKRLWLAATTGASTKVSQRTDTMPACIVLAYSRVAANCSQCNVIITIGTS